MLDDPLWEPSLQDIRNIVNRSFTKDLPRFERAEGLEIIRASSKADIGEIGVMKLLTLEDIHVFGIYCGVYFESYSNYLQCIFGTYSEDIKHNIFEIFRNIFGIYFGIHSA